MKIGRIVFGSSERSGVLPPRDNLNILMPPGGKPSRRSDRALAQEIRRIAWLLEAGGASRAAMQCDLQKLADELDP